MKTNAIFALLLFAVAFGGSPLAAEEPTVAEQTRIRDREQMVAYLVGKDHQTTTVTGLATLPDGKPAVGFKIGKSTDQ